MSREHKILSSPYHICGRCGTVQRLSNLVWELGVLVCTTNNCDDKEVIGERDAQISRILETGTDTELVPDNKLMNPDDEITADEIMF